MRIEVSTRRHRCGLGVCKEAAELCIVPDRVGVRGNLYVCRKCLVQIVEQAGKVLVPKSPANMFERNRLKNSGVIMEPEVNDPAAAVSPEDKVVKDKTGRGGKPAAGGNAKRGGG